MSVFILTFDFLFLNYFSPALCALCGENPLKNLFFAAVVDNCNLKLKIW
jgi:hypothetical protein